MMIESDLDDLLRQSAATRRKKAKRVLTPKVLAEALSAAKALDDQRKAAMVQLQLLAEFARSRAELSLDALGPVDAIQKALLWAEARDISKGAPRMFDGNRLAALLAVHWLRKTGSKLEQAIAEVAPHCGMTATQLRNARKDFVGHKTGTKKMREIYNARINIKCTAEDAARWAEAAISRIEQPDHKKVE